MKLKDAYSMIHHANATKRSKVVAYPVTTVLWPITQHKLKKFEREIIAAADQAIVDTKK